MASASCEAILRHGAQSREDEQRVAVVQGENFVQRGRALPFEAPLRVEAVFLVVGQVVEVVGVTVAGLEVRR
jgi:hypothetical protein